MSLECSVCCYAFDKLKTLSCRHAFCAHCLEQIELNRQIRCPLCRQETSLNAFGVPDLVSRFGGSLQCAHCNETVEMSDGVWCQDCTNIFCKTCSESLHCEHNTERVDRLGPVRFSIQNLDKFARVHTKLALIQKRLIREYVQQLGNELERELDEDLASRMTRLKAEKEHLKLAFELNPENVHQSSSGSEPMGDGEDAAVEPSSPISSSLPMNSDHFASVLNEVYKMSATSLQCRAQLGRLPQTGLIFNPPSVDKAVQLFFEHGKFASFAIGMASLRKRPLLRGPSTYIGAGLLDEPCDMCFNSYKGTVHVTNVHQGLYTFVLGHNEELYLHQPLSQPNDQCAGVTYDALNRFIITTVLREFSTWYVQIYDERYFKLHGEIACPQEPCIGNGWYRWVTALPKSRVLVSSGDSATAALWLLHIHSKRWTLLNSQSGATYRKAAFHQPIKRRKEGLIYVPDVHNRLVVSFVINLENWSLLKSADIRTGELTRELAVAVAVNDGCLVVGNWRTGNIIVADLVNCTSQMLTSLGARQACSICFAGSDKLLLLCKQMEVIQVYDLHAIDTIPMMF